MRETTKSHELRVARDDYKRFLHGKGIDVGAGDDPLTVPDGSVTYWDKPQGDAQILSSIEDSSLDFLYSSHCLEHLPDLRLTLRNWARVLRDGAHAYIVVPDFTLYEHHTWPSPYNGDHKHSFSLWLSPQRVGRPNHWLVGSPEFHALLSGVGLTMIETELQDKDYDYNAGSRDQTLGAAIAQVLIVSLKTHPTPVSSPS